MTTLVDAVLVCGGIRWISTQVWSEGCGCQVVIDHPTANSPWWSFTSRDALAFNSLSIFFDMVRSTWTQAGAASNRLFILERAMGSGGSLT